LNLDIPFFSILMNENKIVQANGAFENTIVVTSFDPTEEFKNKFKQEFGKAAEQSSETSYDAVKILAEAMKKTNSTEPDKIRDYLLSKDSYEGASGKLSFDEFGAAFKESAFLIVKNGKLVDYIK